MNNQIELLAPAGSTECFEAAVENGADAIYLGSPSLNARSLSKDFSYSEIASMISYAHLNNVKVYIAMNSLIKDSDIPAVIESLSIFSGIGVDALIIQDLGLWQIIKRFFPNLRVHASTLMGAHNSLSVKQFSDMGFSRIVLAREMSLPEIQSSCQATDIEIEVFVHGAMCFAFSGLCLFSSYLGGKSGLRGRCVQPCRRLYNFQSNQTGKTGGYFFSMNDLNGINHINHLKKAGVRSFKIEGRMRSRQYVANIVKAYRIMIDNDTNNDKINKQASELIELAMGRKNTPGYFSEQDHSEFISYKHSGNIGQFVGKIQQAHKGKVFVELKAPISRGDRLRIHHEKSGERSSLTINSILLNQQLIDSAKENDGIWLDISILAAKNDTIFKVDTKESRQKRTTNVVNPKKFNAIISKEKSNPRIKKVINQLYPIVKKRIPKATMQRQDSKFSIRKSLKGNKTKKKLNYSSNAKSTSLPWFLKIDDFKNLNIIPQNIKPARVIVLLTPKTIQQFKKYSIPGDIRKKIIWSLPPLIFEDEISNTYQTILWLSKIGFHDWQVSHLSQIELFDSATVDLKQQLNVNVKGGNRNKKKTKRQKKFMGFNLCGNYTLNIMNHQSLNVLKNFGIGMNQISIETDKLMLESISQRKDSSVGLTIYGLPPLFTSRLQPNFFKYGKTLVSPKKEKLSLVMQNNITYAIDDQPFSIIHKLYELSKFGLDFAVVDLSLTNPKNKSLNQIFKQLGENPKNQRLKNFSTFNYLGNLM